MEKITEVFEKEFIDELSKLNPERLTPQDIRILADISAIYAALSHYKMEHRNSMAIEPVNELMSWKNNIEDELKSADEKYREFQKLNDTTVLEMAREELNHAHYYINQAKMSPDMKLREKIPFYEKLYDELALKINAPHGSEKLGRL